MACAESAFEDAARLLSRFNAFVAAPARFADGGVCLPSSAKPSTRKSAASATRAAARPELYVSDGLHMTPAGYAVWTAALRKTLR